MAADGITNGRREAAARSLLSILQGRFGLCLNLGQLNQTKKREHFHLPNRTENFAEMV